MDMSIDPFSHLICGLFGRDIGRVQQRNRWMLARLIEPFEPLVELDLFRDIGWIACLAPGRTLLQPHG